MAKGSNGGLGNITNPGNDPMSFIMGGDTTGVVKQARYAEATAVAEQNARIAVTKEAREARDRANLAAQSPQQLAALERGLSSAQTQVDADLRQLAAIDPAIMEASKQVLELLQGKQAAMNDPAMKQRSSQRENLVNSLRAQYGPGAESSSIGQRALQQFDQQSATMFQQNQMGTLGNAMGIASTRIQGPGFGQLMNVAGGFGDYQNRILGAQTTGDANVLSAMTGEVTGAGAGNVGELIRAGAQRQVATDIHNDGRQIGRTWATMGAGGKGGGDMSSKQQNIGLDGQSQQYRQGNLAYDSQGYGSAGNSYGNFSNYS